MDEQSLLDEITQRLVTEFSPERVILFGSRAGETIAWRLAKSA